MPTRRASRSSQCVYKESGRRCRRSGTGEPPICAAHQIAFAEAAQQQQRPARGAIYDLFESVLLGKKVTRKKAEKAWGEFGQILDDTIRTQVPNFVPPPGFQPPPNWMPRQAQPPPEDPQVLEAKREFAAAKRLLGFADTQPITADDVRERKKQLARKYHPDRPGGSLETMQKINAACDVLLRAAA